VRNGKLALRLYVILGYRREVAKNRALLCYYAASSGNFLPTFRDNLSVPSSGFKNPKGNYHYWLRNGPEECGSYLSSCRMP